MYAHQTLLINSIPDKFAISNIIGKKLPLEWLVSSRVLQTTQTYSDFL